MLETKLHTTPKQTHQTNRCIFILMYIWNGRILVQHIGHNISWRVIPEEHSLLLQLRLHWVSYWCLCWKLWRSSLWRMGFLWLLRQSPLHRCHPGSALSQNTHNTEWILPLFIIHDIQTCNFNQIWGTYLIVRGLLSVASLLSSDIARTCLQTAPCMLQIRKDNNQLVHLWCEEKEIAVVGGCTGSFCRKHRYHSWSTLCWEAGQRSWRSWASSVSHTPGTTAAGPSDCPSHWACTCPWIPHRSNLPMPRQNYAHRGMGQTLWQGPDGPEWHWAQSLKVQV